MPLRPALVAVVGALLLAACSGDDGDAGCGPILREALDPGYLVHVLADDPSVEYRSDPPTSGPHQPTPPVEGAIDRTLTRPVQVGLLEQGDVLIQYRPADLSADQIDELVGLAGEDVVVAPNEQLPETIVATAWLYKRSCPGLDAAALQELIDERAGRGPDQE